MNQNFKRTKFKKRWQTSILFPTLRWGNGGFFLEKQYTFELIYYAMLKRMLKKKYIVKRTLRRTRKVWFFLKKNTPLTKKSKNSRMGKGKGSVLRWAIRFKKNFIFAETQNINIYFLKMICLFVEKKLNMKINYIRTPFKKQTYLGLKTPLFFFTSKYNMRIY